jgi:hypothetical protein
LLVHGSHVIVLETCKEPFSAIQKPQIRANKWRSQHRVAGADDHPCVYALSHPLHFPPVIGPHCLTNDSQARKRAKQHPRRSADADLPSLLLLPFPAHSCVSPPSPHTILFISNVNYSSSTQATTHYPSQSDIPSSP